MGTQEFPLCESVCGEPRRRERRQLITKRCCSHLEAWSRRRQRLGPTGHSTRADHCRGSGKCSPTLPLRRGPGSRGGETVFFQSGGTP